MSAGSIGGVLSLGQRLLRGVRKAPFKSIDRLSTVATGATIGVPVVGTLMSGDQRKRELYNDMNPDGTFNFNATDRIFGLATGVNEAGMEEYTDKRLKRTAAEANARLGLKGEKQITVLDGDTPYSLKGRIKRKDAAVERSDDLQGLLTESTAIYNLPQNQEARRLEQQRYNDTLLREAQIRADATNARVEGNLLTLQLAQMNDRADHRREKAAARSQLVAALVGSLGNLGDAFVSI
jgi:hypothetical protein